MLRPVGSRRLRASGVLAIVLIVGLVAAADYTIRPGDTLSSIAKRHNTSVSELARLNGISNTNHIVAGRTLKLPGAASGGAASAGYVVQRGDTLSGIAAAHGVRTSELAAANGISNRHYIRAGQRLVLPGRGGATATPAASRSSSGGSAAAPAAAASRAEVGRLLEQTADRYGMNPATVKAIAWQESGWNNQRVSSAGAIGIMQVMPSTGRWVSSNLVGRPLDLNKPADNVEAGVAFWRYLHRVTGGDLDQMLAGYYQGLASVSRNGMYDDTKRYIANVRALRARF